MEIVYLELFLLFCLSIYNLISMFLITHTIVCGVTWLLPRGFLVLVTLGEFSAHGSGNYILVSRNVTVCLNYFLPFSFLLDQVVSFWQGDGSPTSIVSFGQPLVIAAHAHYYCNKASWGSVAAFSVSVKIYPSELERLYCRSLC